MRQEKIRKHIFILSKNIKHNNNNNNNNNIIGEWKIKWSTLLSVLQCTSD
jgi:hypothetical protein